MRFKQAMKKNQETKYRAELSKAHLDHKKGLDRHAFAKTGNRATSEDLVQNTFMKTWNYLLKGGKIDVMKAFLYHILECLIIDDYRKQKSISLENMINKGFEPQETSEKNGHSSRFFNISNDSEVETLIKKLPIKYREVMRLRYVKDMTIKEISSATKRSKNAIAVELHRALKKCRSLISL